MAARRLNSRAVRLRRNYTVDEAARVLGVAKGTVRRWLNEKGLPALTDRKPALILGRDLIGFLDARRAPKNPCRLDECYCFSCRTPRRPAYDEVEYIPLTPTSGNIRALCEACATLMHKRVSTANLAALRAIVDVTIRQAGKPIVKSNEPCLIEHLEREP